MQTRHYWFTKWLLALGLLLPMWAFLSLDGYNNDRTFLWNVANHQVVVAFLPDENLLVCLQHDADKITSGSLGFGVGTEPTGCNRSETWPLLYVLAVSAFLLLSGLVFLLTPPETGVPRLVDDADPVPVGRGKRLDLSARQNQPIPGEPDDLLDDQTGKG